LVHWTVAFQEETASDNTSDLVFPVLLTTVVGFVFAFLAAASHPGLAFAGLVYCTHQEVTVTIRYF